MNRFCEFFGKLSERSGQNDKAWQCACQISTLIYYRRSEVALVEPIGAIRPESLESRIGTSVDRISSDGIAKSAILPTVVPVTRRLAIAWSSACDVSSWTLAMKYFSLGYQGRWHVRSVALWG